MKLGAFSVSLSVKDLGASRAFYEKLGFAVIGGVAEQSWLILRNADEVTIGLFQGMFEKNLLTFNPGWNARCENLAEFSDVRQLQAQLKAAGLEVGEAVAGDAGPGYFTLTDPDGNPILIDQHR
ncbi:catechol 2,3-dioxygenase-like lactoylglutathione lyase family enzyme [Inhella inkyongensis]|uniref:Catechol 2,3-dioxygenase-like lactoylglutathione lyase family enzyme n=1 Tax=Inhella inkyongensis TaxID=392593 RepID=A0A840S934_9BURK|nr:VOC family protein [Inhella inkyongensis]MBB5204930.1 catechol 2,3-dioxygenase-like lactoylglutathione lyase family enzyme [Inhella inkyongensis]